MHCCIVVICDEARLVASEEEQQRLLQELGQWKKMFHAREMEMSWLQRESEQLCVQDKCNNNINYYWSSYLNYNNDQMLLHYTVDTVSTSYQQQLKDHNVKEQSTETDFTAQNAGLSFRDKQDISGL